MYQYKAQTNVIFILKGFRHIAKQYFVVHIYLVVILRGTHIEHTVMYKHKQSLYNIKFRDVTHVTAYNIVLKTINMNYGSMLRKIKRKSAYEILNETLFIRNV